MFELARLGLSEVLECGSGVRRATVGATSLEDAAAAVVHYLRESFVDKETGERSLALVRFYKTHPYDRLPPSLQDFARAIAVDQRAMHNVPCLTLLATAGDESTWNDRHQSRGHKAIPLPSAQAVAALPMVHQLVTELGVDVARIVDPDVSAHEIDDHGHGHGHGIFHVADALDSPHVPAQTDFVLPYGVRSVLGFGGVLPDGALFAVVMFAKVRISAETAKRFTSIALSAEVAVLPHVFGPLFAGDPAPVVDDDVREARRVELLDSQVSALTRLLDARHATIVDVAVELETALQEGKQQTDELRRSQAALGASEARKSAVVTAALDPIITMDAAGRVVEWNPAAEEVFGWSSGEAVGEPLADLIIPVGLRDRHARGLARYLETGEGPLLGRRVEVSALRRDGTELPAELAITAVSTNPPLFTGFIRDITERRNVEAALLEGRERLAHIARTLQDSLLPPGLPEIPGVEVGSAYHAAGESIDVGGDFFDVFETGLEDWALVLGDVVGKGAEAAAITGLARYTLRAAAMRARTPKSVLAMLHEAVYRQHPDKYCTAVYVRARVGDDGVRLTVASGGHPLPLHVQAGGDVATVRARGTLLGAMPGAWRGEEADVALAPGDSIVLYSDGVTEARVGGEFFGEERLHGALRGVDGLDAASIARRIETAVLEFAGEPTDDIAVLVLRANP